jgi:hypothetical protein
MFALPRSGFTASTHIRRRRVRAILAGAAVVAVLVVSAGCSGGSTGVPPSRGSPAPPSSSAPGGSVPTVSFVQPPADGKVGHEVAIEGTAQWVVPGRPGCAELHTSHQPQQILSLVGDTADQLRHQAESGRGQVTAQVRITGHAAAIGATVCPGLRFSVTQVAAMNN